VKQQGRAERACPPCVRKQGFLVKIYPLSALTAPGVDHVGSGAPANIDMLAVLVDWVENGKAPEDLVVTEQTIEAAPKAVRARPLCQWPTWPIYKNGDVNQASSFECAK